MPPTMQTDLMVKKQLTEADLTIANTPLHTKNFLLELKSKSQTKQMESLLL
ncbi:hypothetical protein D3C84_714570 [compost metagenome]